MPTSKNRKPRGRKNRQRDAGASRHKQAERDKQTRLNETANFTDGLHPRKGNNR